MEAQLSARCTPQHTRMFCNGHNLQVTLNISGYLAVRALRRVLPYLERSVESCKVDDLSSEHKSYLYNAFSRQGLAAIEPSWQSTARATGEREPKTRMKASVRVLTNKTHQFVQESFAGSPTEVLLPRVPEALLPHPEAPAICKGAARLLRNHRSPSS